MIKKFFASILCVILCGCAGKENISAEKTPPAPQKFPAEKAVRGERAEAARLLAQKYIDALNKSLRTGDFSFLRAELPRKVGGKRAEQIFVSMRKGLARYGELADCRFLTRLDCTLYVDYLWKYKFVKKTGDPQFPEQIFEVLYRVRVIHPEKTPVIINADFMFR